jgi:hypothetical protein
MTRNSTEAGGRELQRAALRKVLQVLLLNERPAAELFGVPYSKLNNITRTASRSSLDKELALKIQAATGISAASLMRGDKMPLMLNGKPVNLESYQAWKNHEISQEAKESQALELGLKMRLLLNASGEKGAHLRRRTYHLLRSLLEEMKESAGISMTEIHAEAAKLGVKRRPFTATREELDEMLGKAPSYQAARNRLPATGAIQVIEETFPTWAEALQQDLIPGVLDSQSATMKAYFLEAGDSWIPVIEIKGEAKGLGTDVQAKKIRRKIGKPIKDKPRTR